LKGNQALSEVDKQKPYKWLLDQGWKDLQKLVTISDVYKNLIEDL
jgi:hypothetical protein